MSIRDWLPGRQYLEILAMAGIVGVWLLLQLVILPRAGIST
jgi:hypothetical protein